MKLFYYQRRDDASNFGDSLNPWLWNQLLPGVLDDDETTAFVGIGTLLNEVLTRRVPLAQRLVVFSSGVGYKKHIPVINEHWKIYCVRGFLSAQKLGVDAKLAVTDGAILVRRLFKPTGDKVSRFAFMPHVHHATFASAAWKEICEDLGFGYIDPRWPIEQVLTAISQTEVLLAEAMHGAIVADALAVPWIPIRTSTRILAFKWLDWCSSIGVDYQPRYIMPLLGGYPPLTGNQDLSRQVTQHWMNCLKQDQLRSLTRIMAGKQKVIAAQLKRITQTTRPCLSNAHQLEELTVELEQRLHQFKMDCGECNMVT